MNAKNTINIDRCKPKCYNRNGKALETVLKELGIDATVEELKAYVGANGAEGKLDKSQLDEVAGGPTPTVATVIPVASAGLSIATIVK